MKYLQQNSQGPEVKELHERLLKIGSLILKDEIERSFYGETTATAVRRVQKSGGLEEDGTFYNVVSHALDNLEAVYNARNQASEDKRPSHCIFGRAFMEYGVPAEEMELHFRKIGSPSFFKEELSASVKGQHTTDRQGYFRCFFNDVLPEVPIEIITANPNPEGENEEELEKDKQVILTVPGAKDSWYESQLVSVPTRVRPLEPEYTRLVRDIKKGWSELHPLQEVDFRMRILREGASRRDITMLRLQTKWDARLIGLATIADRLAGEDEIFKMMGSPEMLYGLFRVGVPTNKDDFILYGVESLKEALSKAKESEIIGLNDGEFENVFGLDAIKAYEALHKAAVRKLTLKGGISSFSELVRAFFSGEADVDYRLEDDKIEELEDYIWENPDLGSEFWIEKVEEGFINEKQLTRLRLVAGLARITFNNVLLVKYIVDTSGVKTIADLLEYSGEELVGGRKASFSDISTWISMLRRVAIKYEQDLQKLVPGNLVETHGLEEALAHYAERMAKEVRMSFPDHALLEWIREGRFDESGEHLRHLFENAIKLGSEEGRSFEIGNSSVGSFFDENIESLLDVVDDAEERRRVATAAKAVARIYQISLSRESFLTLYQWGLRSSEDVVELPHHLFERGFVRRFKKFVPEERSEERAERTSATISEEEIVLMSRLIYAKAQQVVSITRNVFASVQSAANSIPMAALSTGEEDSDMSVYARSTGMSGYSTQRSQGLGEFANRNPWLRNQKRNTTLANIFGANDYFTCEHCDSVLSPAAYLVDLLEYINPNEILWSEIQFDWEQKNHGSSYKEKYGEGASSLTPFQVLQARRPDIPNLKLNCDNTDRILPQIDLVNEVLERVVSGGALDDAFVEETSDLGEREDLLVRPQEGTILRAAYKILADAVYPIGLPFNLPLETVRLICDRFEMPLREIAELAIPSRDPDAKEWEYRIAVESIGVFPQQAQTLVSEFSEAHFNRINGFGAEWSIEDKVVDGERQAGLLTLLWNAQEFTERLGLSYVELDEVVRSQFVQSGDRPIEIRLMDPYVKKDFQSYYLYRPIKGNNPLERDIRPSLIDYTKINYFTRLWRMLGWSIEDLDYALRVFLPQKNGFINLRNIGDAMGYFLRCCACVSRVGRILGAGDSNLKITLSLWDEDRELGERWKIIAELLGEDSEELKRYSEASGIDPFINDSSLPFGTNVTFTPLCDFVEDIHLLKECGIGIINANRLFAPAEWARNAENELVSAMLSSVENTTKIFDETPLKIEQRGGSLPDLLSLGYSDSDLSLLSAMWDATAKVSVVRDNVADDARLEQEEFQRMISQVWSIKNLKVTVEFTGEASRTEVVIIQGVVTKEILQKIPNEGDRGGEEFKVLEQASKRWIEHARKLLGPTASDEEIEEFLELIAGEDRQPVSEGLARRMRWRAIASSVGAFCKSRVGLDSEMLDLALNDSGLLSSGGGNSILHTFLEAFLKSDVAGFGGRAFRSFIRVVQSGAYRIVVDGEGVEAISITLGGAKHTEGDFELLAGMLHELEIELDGQDLSQVKIWLIGDDISPLEINRQSVFSTDSYSIVSNAWKRLLKLVELCEIFELHVEELAWFGKFDEKREGMAHLIAAALDDELETIDKAKRFRFFRNLADYKRLKANLGINDGSLVKLIAAIEKSKEKMVALIAECFDQDVEVIQQAVECLGFEDNPDVSALNILERITKVLEVQRKTTIGISVWQEVASVLNAQTNMDVGFDLSKKLENRLLRANEYENWKVIAKPIYDRLRTKRRDALVSYLLYDKSFNTVEDLFEEYLLDPGVEPLVETSRLKQATLSVQLFIHRCFLNLESRVSPYVLNKKHWEWMKNYRVWEANRKIFLYPENWLEPEFRQGKSHLFTQLESSLLQGDVTEDLIEKSMHDYLVGLDEIAKLDIVSFFNEQEVIDPAGSVFHVVGRTYGMPKKYFYRTYSRLVWSPWLPIDAGIEGDHVVSAVWKGRFCVFWVSFLEKTDANQVNTAYNKIGKIDGLRNQNVGNLMVGSTVQAQLHWSEYYKGEWSESRASLLSRSVSFGIPQGSHFNAEKVSLYISRGAITEAYDRKLLEIDQKIGEVEKTVRKLNDDLRSKNDQRREKEKSVEISEKEVAREERGVLHRDGGNVGDHVVINKPRLHAAIAKRDRLRRELQRVNSQIGRIRSQRDHQDSRKKKLEIEKEEVEAEREFEYSSIDIRDREEALFISLELGSQEYIGGSNKQLTYRLLNRYSDPTVEDTRPPQRERYTKQRVNESKKKTLEVRLESKLSGVDHVNSGEGEIYRYKILENAGDFIITPGGSSIPYIPNAFPELVSPFFFVDQRHAFLVDPVYREKTTTFPVPIEIEDLIKKQHVHKAVRPQFADPKPGPKPNPIGPRYDPLVLDREYEDLLEPSKRDWLLDDGAILKLDDSYLSAHGIEFEHADGQIKVIGDLVSDSSLGRRDFSGSSLSNLVARLEGVDLANHEDVISRLGNASLARHFEEALRDRTNRDFGG